jgi:hypothetical protein
MINGIDDIQKLGQQNLDLTMKSVGEWNKGMQAIAAELNDYTKRAFEDGSSAFEKLSSARSLEQAMAIQMDFARRSYEDYVAQCTKITNMYADIARGAMQPVERSFASRR